MHWTNYHGHCNYCDGHGFIEDYIQKAIELNMRIVGISSHAPVPFDTCWTMSVNRLDDYMAEVQRLKEQYQDQITVLTSLEVDFVSGVTGPSSSRFESLNLDYTIGSVHFVDQFEDGTYWAIDGSLEEFEKGVEHIFNGDVKKAVQRFYAIQREMLETHCFDIIGHLDKIKMHNLKKPFFNEDDEWYQRELNQLLILIKENNVIVEINTKSLKRNGILFPDVKLFPRLIQMEIPITINSDAHYPKHLLEGFSFVASELKKCGLKTLQEYTPNGWHAFEFSNKGIQF